VERAAAARRAEERGVRRGKSPRAGEPATAADRVDVAKLVDAYAAVKPDPHVPSQRVSFGTSGHRGSSLDASFNEAHLLAIAEAICAYRQSRGIAGPLFLGIDTHALSKPASETIVEVLAAHDVELRIAPAGATTPTPAVSRAIVAWNGDGARRPADGIVVTPSHNPPESGGVKYNPPHGGPAETEITRWIEALANDLLARGAGAVRRITLRAALAAPGTREHDFLGAYVEDLPRVIDLAAIRSAGVRMVVDPLGGAGVDYWPRIAERYGLALESVSQRVDPTFGFMTLDWDGRIRMDPSSRDAMQRLLGWTASYDVAFACDTDHDRHGIVTPGAGLLEPNHYLAVAADYLFRERPDWPRKAGLGKTVVTSALLDRLSERLGRALAEMPVGFKWFVPGLCDGSLAFAGEESAGATLACRDGSPWTTDKDGIAAALLAGEITARTRQNPAERYRALASELGDAVSERWDATATAAQREKLGRLRARDLALAELGGEPILRVLDRAPGNGEPIGGIKAETASGWFAARPSGTEDVTKLYGESFRGAAHLERLLGDGQVAVERALERARPA
jgi:phosphoglucomutase